MRLDPLHLFAVSAALFFASVLFLIAIMSNVSASTAATRALISWVVLSFMGVIVAMVIRWVLQAPGQTHTGHHLDVTLPAAAPDER